MLLFSTWYCLLVFHSTFPYGSTNCGPTMLSLCYLVPFFGLAITLDFRLSFAFQISFTALIAPSEFNTDTTSEFTNPVSSNLRFSAKNFGGASLCTWLMSKRCTSAHIFKTSGFAFKDNDTLWTCSRLSGDKPQLWDENQTVSRLCTE